MPLMVVVSSVVLFAEARYCASMSGGMGTQSGAFSLMPTISLYTARNESPAIRQRILDLNLREAVAAHGTCLVTLGLLVTTTMREALTDEKRQLERCSGVTCVWLL